MPLDPHAKRFLDMAAAGAGPDIRDVTPERMRDAFQQLALAVGTRDVPISRIEDRPFCSRHGTLPIRIYTPVGRGSERLPGLIYFHGGGFVYGNLDTHDGLCRTLANASDTRVVAIEYPLAPEHGFPAAVEHCCEAAAWVAGNAEGFGIDAARLAIGGDSAGGGIAVTVCQHAKQAGAPALALQVLFCPVMDMCPRTESRRAFATGYFLDHATMEWCLRHYSPAGLDPSDPRLSPLHALALCGLPPAHIHTAEFDPVRDEGKAYADRLEREGVAVRYICHPGMIHHFYGMGGVIPYARTAIAAAGEAIRIALASL